MGLFDTGGGSISSSVSQNPTALGGNATTGAFFSSGAQPTMPGAQDLLYGNQTVSASGSNLLILGGGLLFFALVMKGKL